MQETHLKWDQVPPIVLLQGRVVPQSTLRPSETVYGRPVPVPVLGTSYLDLEHELKIKQYL